MARYLSLSWKMLLLMLSMLLLLLLGFTSLSLLHMQEQFQRQQAQRHAQGQQYFTFYNQAVEQQLLTWLQSYAELQQLHHATDFNQFAEQLLQQTELLQQNFSVTKFSLFNPQQQLLQQSGGSMPDAARVILQQTEQQQRPQSAIHCDKRCYKLLSLPLLNKYGDVAVLLLVTELTEVLYSMHQTLGVDVAVVHYQAALTDGLAAGLLQASNRELVQKIYSQLADDSDITSLRQQGTVVKLDHQQFYLHRIPLDNKQPDEYLLLVLEDISEVMRENIRYQQKVLWLAAGCFVAMALLILLLTRSLSRRILHLAQTLPLLAQRRYVQFRQRSASAAGVITDELSLFSDAVQTLSHDLEKLDQQLAEKTGSLEQMAMFDQLTGLGNRNMLQYQLQQALAALAQHPGFVGIVFLDLDKFKNINNSRSHAVGDQLLIETAARLRQVVSATDIVCRFGGDEFAIVIPHLTDVGQAEQLATQVLAIFNQPFALQHGSVKLTASIGVSTSNDSNISSEELIRQADLAMYQAKNNGRNCFYLFNQQMSSDLANRLQLEAELRLAIVQQQFYLCFQPQVNLASGKLSGFEALLRWQHPQRGVVAPDEFISVLEQTQLIVDVGYWVFEHSCRYCVALIAQGLTDITISVNVSAAQFLQADLPQKLAQLLQQFGLSAHHFELELTESTLVSQVSQTLDVMYQLKAQGFSFAIDDYGTGYSSLNYIKRMPVDTIKIDKSFVLGMLDNPSDYQIVVSTIAMVQKLGLQVVAEGVESLAHLALLRKHNCNVAQGYYLSRPIAESQLSEFVSHDVLQQQWPVSLLSQ